MLKRFKVIITPEIEGGYSVSCPALGAGCVSQGESTEEALENIKDAIQLFIQSLVEDNLPIPDPTEDPKLREVEVSL